MEIIKRTTVLEKPHGLAILTGEEGSCPLDSGLDLPADDADYDALLKRLEGRVASLRSDVASEHHAGAVLWAELESLLHEHRALLVANVPRFARWGLYDRLVTESTERLAGEPLDSLYLAELAQDVATRLPARYGPLRADYEVSALLVQANAYRRLRNFTNAGRLIAAARERLSSSSGDPLVKAALLEERAAFHKDVGDLSRALYDLDGAARIHREIGNRVQEGELRLLRSDILGVLRPSSGLEELERSLDLFSVDDSPWVELEATHCRIRLLAEIGEPWRAWDLLEESRPLYRRFEQARVRAMRLWLEGRVLRGMGDLEEAEIRCRRALIGLGQLGLTREALRCSLDLAGAAWSIGGHVNQRRAQGILARGLSEVIALGFQDDVQARWTCLAVAGVAPTLQRHVVDGLLRNWSRTRAVPASHLFHF